MSKEKQKSAKKQQKKVPGRPFKPGQSGNPKGHPKGMPNRSTIVKKILEANIKSPDTIERAIKAMFPKLANKKMEARVVMIIRMVQKAIVKGDTKAFELLMNYGYGKETDKLDLTSGGKSIVDIIEQLENDK